MMSIVLKLMLLLLSSCAIEVGNPHPDPDEKSSVQVTIGSDEEMSVEEIELNIIGIKFIRNDDQSENTVFLQPNY